MSASEPSFTEISGDLAEYKFYQDDSQIQFLALPEKAKNWLPLLSPRDPKRETDRLLGEFTLRKGLLAIVRGISSLPTIDKLYSMQKANGGWLIVLEADTRLHKAIANRIPGSIPVFTADSEKQLAGFMETFPVEEMTGYRFFGQSATRLAPQFYSRIENQLKQGFASRLSDLFTRMEFESTWLANALQQIKHFTRAKPASATFGKFSGSAIMVATGPSLRYHLNWLRESQSRLFIAAADSAWRVLHRCGIKPDLIYSLDSQPFTFKHFAGLPKPGAGEAPALFADLVANPRVIDEWRGDLYLSQTAHWLGEERHVTPGCDILEREFFSDRIGVLPGDVQSGGSVATSIFDLLRQMGFDSLVLVGQDLAYTDREIHCTGTHHTDQWLGKTTNRFTPLETINDKVVRKRHTSLSPSLQGGMVPADYILGLYAKWFSESAATVPFPVYNASFNGLKVQNLQRALLPAQPYPEKSRVSAREEAAIHRNNQSVDASKFYNPAMKQKLKELQAPPLFGDRENILRYLTNLLNKEESQVLNEPVFARIGRKYTIKAVRSSSEEEARRNLKAADRTKLAFHRSLFPRLEPFLNTTSG